MANKWLIRGFNTACLGQIGVGIFLKLQECPAGTLSDGFVVVLRQPFQYGQEFLPSAIAHRDYRVTAEAGPLGASNGGAAKSLPEFFFRNLGEPVQSGIDQAGASIELGRSGCWGLAVPRANVLADVAAKVVASHA